MPTVVIAIGGNSLIPDADQSPSRTSTLAAAETDDHIASLIEAGWDVAISHGNGPQVGFILRRSEMSSSELHEIPLDYCGADTQGAIGYMLQQNLINDLRQRGHQQGCVATVVTQVEVDSPIPAFEAPRSRSARSWTRPRPCAGGTKRAGMSRRTPGEDGAASWPPRLRCASSSSRSSPAARCRCRDHRRRWWRDPRRRQRRTATSKASLPSSTRIWRPPCWPARSGRSAAHLDRRRAGGPQLRQGERGVGIQFTLAEVKQYLARGRPLRRGLDGAEDASVVQYLEAGGKEALITEPAEPRASHGRRNRNQDRSVKIRHRASPA